MTELNFMIGEWVGTSTLISGGKVSKESPAFQSISYDLKKSIVVIQLKSEPLTLHTIVRYEEKDSTYYYHVFSEKGAGKFPARLEGGKLIVQAGDSRRYIFQRIGSNGFREYGEELRNGKWVKYFEDNFVDIKQ